MQMIDIEMLPNETTLPLIQVGHRTIAQSDIAQEMQYHPSDSAGSAQLKAARALVVRELLCQRAQDQGLIDADKMADDQVIAQLLQQELNVPKPTTEDCQRFYAHYPERFSEPTRLKVRHVLLAAAPEDAVARDAQYQQGVTLLEALKEAPTRFTEFAQRYSACPSSTQGGELGWLAKGQTVAELDRVLHHLPDGLHERPIASRYGWHLVVIDAREESQLLPYAAVTDRVRHHLDEQATRRAVRHYLLVLEAEVGVQGVALDDDAGGSLMQ